MTLFEVLRERQRRQIVVPDPVGGDVAQPLDADVAQHLAAFPRWCGYHPLLHCNSRVFFIVQLNLRIIFQKGNLNFGEKLAIQTLAIQLGWNVVSSVHWSHFLSLLLGDTQI